MAKLLALLFAALLTNDGVTLHYSVIGTGEPVIVLSGGPGFSADSMRPVAEHLAERYAAVVLEQRGTPKSPLAKYDETTLTVPLAVADLEALRAKLGVEKLTLVGHSWGGMLAMAYAAEHPERVRAMVLVDSGGPTIDFMKPFGERMAARTTPEDKAAQAKWRTPEARKANERHATIEAMRAGVPAYFHDRAKSRAFAEALNDDSYDSRVFRALMADMAKHYDSRPGLRKLAAPVLIVQGDDDPIGTFDELRAALPKAQAQLVAGAGHFPWLEQPATFWDAVDRFLTAYSK